ncbi:MAG: HAD-IIIA family hydrolase, partial [Saprospiraceae bacterium]|nr:HAD-IIIA family hydrolase [Saprospiraceae bacterium]
EYYNYPIDVLLKQDLKAKYEFKTKDIKLLILDVDGVMTDGGMYYTEGGDEFKKFDTKDGMAIKKLTASGFPIGIISSGFNANLVERRAKLLGIQNVYVGGESKMGILKKWCKELAIQLENVAFIGDDINDEEVMKAVGFSACPANAVDKIKNIASVILKREGGNACIREFVDEWMLSS